MNITIPYLPVENQQQIFLTTNNPFSVSLDMYAYT